jgi:hypothetical protein
MFLSRGMYYEKIAICYRGYTTKTACCTTDYIAQKDRSTVMRHIYPNNAPKILSVRQKRESPSSRHQIDTSIEAAPDQHRNDPLRLVQ